MKASQGMIPLSALEKKFLKIGATAYGGPAIAQEIKRAIVKNAGAGSDRFRPGRLD